MTNTEFRYIRKELKMNQAEFGFALGLADPQVQISRIESGKVAVSKQIEIICLYIKRYGVLPEFKQKKVIPPEILLDKENLK